MSSDWLKTHALAAGSRCLYEKLRQQVLRRDGWRCQSCGTMSNLEVHHKEFRSQSGDDSEANLITLCTNLGTHSYRLDPEAGRNFCAPQEAS
jgi:5-methylcytosine-specific restriction endonuclease McrA